MTARAARRPGPGEKPRGEGRIRALVKAMLSEAGGGSEPGDLKASARPTPTAGWLNCDGAAVSRTEYADLFAAIGTSYGAGDGAATFNLPDFQGRALVGAGAGTGLTQRLRGEMFGAETHTLTTAQLDAHQHPFTVGIASNTTTGGTANRVFAVSAGGNTTIVDTQLKGSSEAHPNVQPSAVARIYIKT